MFQSKADATVCAAAGISLGFSSSSLAASRASEKLTSWSGLESALFCRTVLTYRGLLETIYPGKHGYVALGLARETSSWTINSPQLIVLEQAQVTLCTKCGGMAT